MLGKQAKALSLQQTNLVLGYLDRTRYPIRNRVIFLLSFKAGLRAKEIANITWAMVLSADGSVSDEIRLENGASKGRSGGVIPMSKHLKSSLAELLSSSQPVFSGNRVIQTSRSGPTSPQVIVNMFYGWYKAVGLIGCSSHSGRRTFITQAARNIGRFGGSLRDVQALARHQSLAMTQRYIDIDAEAMRKVVNL
jgi:integrase/recombinase XerD